MFLRLCNIYFSSHVITFFFWMIPIPISLFSGRAVVAPSFEAGDYFCFLLKQQLFLLVWVPIRFRMLAIISDFHCVYYGVK